MAGKISEMSAASALDGSELVEVVQSGANKSVTVNDLLPVQLQEDKEIDLNGHELEVGNGNLYVTNGEQYFNAKNSTGDGNLTIIDAATSDGSASFTLSSDFNDGEKHAQILGSAISGLSEIGYSADTHTFNGSLIIPDLVALDFVNDTAAATGLVPVGGLYHTMGVLKIRLS